MKAISLRPLATLLLFGATVGTLLDALHTFSGTTEYTHPFVFQTAWWVPLLFANAYGVGGFLFAHAYRLIGGPPALRTPRELAVGIACFVLLYALSAYLPASNVVKLGVLLAATVALFVALDRTWQGALLAGTAVFFGPLVEHLISSAGLFHYWHPDVLGLPMWLPVLYLASGPTVGQLARFVVARDEASEPAIA